ncbi:hypothetical protein CC86DRAFT_88456 [Ophiobolus disseminans]|uniref:Secreted protein n=1 Tax=Ophiobolus disseminans TaxID=1469910 RepID=A0A6A7AGB5_9PLEO|nr:hypothetical protein CC86DRAFT_88456 [Ophiobolus disseminans]
MYPFSSAMGCLALLLVSYILVAVASRNDSSLLSTMLFLLSCPQSLFHMVEVQASPICSRFRLCTREQKG